MARASTMYKVLIGSPSDVPEEREIAFEVIEAWNRAHADAEGVVLRCVRWELDSTPELGDRPQALLNDQIVDDSDVLVALFWGRAGRPTGVAASGTEEEIARFVAAGKRVMLYFSDRDPPAAADPAEVNRVRELRKRFHGQGICGSYRSLQEFKDRLSEHISRVVHDLKERSHPLPKVSPNDGLTADDILVLAAVAERRDEYEDSPDPWRLAPSGVEIQVRTGLEERKLSDVARYLDKHGFLQMRPLGPGEKPGSRFAFSAMIIEPEGQRALDARPPVSLPGLRLPAAVNVPENYPENEGMVWDEQRRGFRVEWVSELLLTDALKGGSEVVLREIGNRLVRLRHPHVPQDLVLVRTPLRPRTDDEASALVNERFGGLAFLIRDGDDIVAKRHHSTPSFAGGKKVPLAPPATAGYREVARGKTAHSVLADLEIRLAE
jgi:hypothetical protein